MDSCVLPANIRPSPDKVNNLDTAPSSPLLSFSQLIR
jgi:hypothetical protein